MVAEVVPVVAVVEVVPVDVVPVDVVAGDDVADPVEVVPVDGVPVVPVDVLVVPVDVAGLVSVGPVDVAIEVSATGVGRGGTPPHAVVRIRKANKKHRTWLPRISAGRTNTPFSHTHARNPAHVPGQKCAGLRYYVPTRMLWRIAE